MFYKHFILTAKQRMFYYPHFMDEERRDEERPYELGFLQLQATETLLLKQYGNAISHLAANPEVQR